MMQKEFIGGGAISALPTLLPEFNVRSLFLLHGKSSYTDSGIAERIKPLLAGVRVTEWSDFSPNPSSTDLFRGLQLFAASPADCLVSVGGGSVMDMAKLLKYFSGGAGGSGDVVDPAALLAAGGPSGRWNPIPHIAIPTTSGSGTEATHFAVIYVDGIKHSVSDARLLPEAAIVDHELTHTLPPSQTAVSGMDALCQAVESYWSIHSTEASRAEAADAITAVLRHLSAAVKNPSPADRNAMALAAHKAGRAINVTRTTAPHAISYTLTARFGVPHGHAVALTLGDLFVYNAGVGDADVEDPRGESFVKARLGEIAALFGCQDAHGVRAAVTSLMKSIGLETRLEGVGVRTAADRALIADGVNLERLRNNPRRLTREALLGILEGR